MPDVDVSRILTKYEESYMPKRKCETCKFRITPDRGIQY